MGKRVISAVVGVVILVGVLFLNQYSSLILNGAIAIVAAIGVFEIVRAVGLVKYKSILSVCLLLALFVPFSQYLFSYELPVVPAVIYAFTLFLFAHTIIHHDSLSFKEIVVVYAMSLLIPFALSTMLYARDHGGVHGIFYFVLILIGAWSSDIGAYFIGSFFGRNKLIPEISPKKTVEGFVGGIASCVIVMLLSCVCYLWLFAPQGTEFIWWRVLLMGVMSSCISVIGDLSFSLVKRTFHIKDFGNIMPGHGGALDRFDSVIFVAPFVYYFLRFLPIVIG